MSPDTRVVTAFRPAALPVSAVEADAGARAAGYAAGWAAGSRAAAEQSAAQQRRLAEQSALAHQERTDAAVHALEVLGRAAGVAAGRTVPVVEEVRRALYAAALDLAEAVLQRELTPGPTSARAVLARALAVPPELGVHTVRLNPADLVAATALLDAGELSLPAGVALVADPRLAAGDAISEHPAGFLDGQVATALDRARRALLEDAL